jgi:hypothetical protein
VKDCRAVNLLVAAALSPELPGLVVEVITGETQPESTTSTDLSCLDLSSLDPSANVKNPVRETIYSFLRAKD